MRLEERRTVDDGEVQSFVDRLIGGQRFGGALTAGICCAVVGVTVWGTFLDWIGWRDQWGWQVYSCIIVSAAVGFAIRVTGRGVDGDFAALGAVLGALVPVAGELFASAYQQKRVSGGLVLFSLADLGQFVISRSGWDWLLFIFGGWAGSHLARTRLDRDEIRAALSWRPPDERDQLADGWLTWDRGI